MIKGFSLFMVFFMLLSVLALGGCDTAPPPDHGDDAGNGTPPPALKTVTVALNSAPVTTDPHNHRHRNTQTLVRNWTDGLTQTMPDGSNILDLAVSIDQLDEITYEIILREDVTFHNGDLMTAEDVVFTIKRIEFEGFMEGQTSPRSIGTAGIDSVEQTGEFSLIVKTKTAAEMLYSAWYNAEVIPKKYFEEVGVDKFLEHPIGVGPFKWVQGDLAGEIILERYENYYGGAAKLPGEVDRVPALDRVIFRTITEPTTRVAALMAGDVDIIQHVPVDSIELLENDPNIRVERQDGTSIKAMWFNTTKAPFTDKRVRQAIAYAIDYDLIVDQFLLGYAEVLYGRPFLIPFRDDPLSGQFDHIESPYRYDPGKARALLEEAGAVGFSCVIDVLPEDANLGQVIGQMMGDIGINASVRVWGDFGTIDSTFKEGQRDMFIVGWGNANRKPTWIRNVASTGVSGNFALYSNPTFDNLIRPANAMLDSPERTAMFIEAFEIIMEDIPVIALFNPDVVEACRIHVKNFFPHNAGRVNLHRVDVE